MKPEVPGTDHFDTDAVSCVVINQVLRLLPICKSLLNAFHTTLSFICTNMYTQIVQRYKLSTNVNLPTCFGNKPPSLGRRHIAKEHILFIHKVTGAVLRTHIFVFGATTPPVGQGLLVHEVSRSHTTTHHSR
jgi:hypothetical protein